MAALRRPTAGRPTACTRVGRGQWLKWQCVAGGAQPLRHRRRKGSLVGRHHGECGARAYNGGLGAKPLVRGSGGRSPPEAESILVIGCPTEPANLAPVCENSMFCYGPLARLRF